MLAAVRTVALARVAALAVAVALSGAPRLATARHESEHRCQCPAHAIQRDCSCGKCRSAHGSVTGGAACARHGRPAPRGGPGSPRVIGSCGMPDAPAAPPSGVDLFTLPGATAIALADRAEPLRARADTSPPRESAPETPPPRAA